MRARPKFLAVVLALLSAAAGLSLPVPVPAEAGGAGSFTFEVKGTLPKFPTVSGTASFSGTTSGNATVTATSGTSIYTANLEMTQAPIAGSVSYGSPSGNYCPLFTTAQPSPGFPWYGQVTMDVRSPTVTGLVYRSGETLTGVISRTLVTFRFTYQRVGATAAIVLTGGTITVYYVVPGRPEASFTSSFMGAGGAVVTFDNPAQALSNCNNPNNTTPLGFKMTGDIAVAS